MAFSSGFPSIFSTSFWKCRGRSAFDGAPSESPKPLMNSSNCSTLPGSGSSCTRYSPGPPALSRKSATVSFASSMNSSIRRCATLRSRDDDVLDEAGVVHHDFGLGEIEVDRAAAPPAQVENLEQLAHQLEQRHQRRVLGHRLRITVRENRVHGRVRHPRIAVDDAVVELGVRHLAHPRDFHQARLHETVDARIQRAEPRRQLRGEHVQGALGEVHRGAALVGFGVERAALVDVVRHVGDVHAEQIVPVRQLLKRDRIVEVARVLAVDRHRLAMAEVSAPADVAWPDLAAETPRLRDRLVSMDVGQLVLPDDDARVDTGLIEPADHLDDVAERRPRRRSASASARRRPFRRIARCAIRPFGTCTSARTRRSNGTT